MGSKKTLYLIVQENQLFCVRILLNLHSVHIDLSPYIIVLHLINGRRLLTPVFSYFDNDLVL